MNRGWEKRSVVWRILRRSRVSTVLFPRQKPSRIGSVRSERFPRFRLFSHVFKHGFFGKVWNIPSYHSKCWSFVLCTRGKQFHRLNFKKRRLFFFSLSRDQNRRRKQASTRHQQGTNTFVLCCWNRITQRNHHGKFIVCCIIIGRATAR